MSDAVRALDHLVLPSRDLGATAARLAALGFFVGRRNRHPWGTENHVVQFDGVFLEPIALAPDQAPPLAEDDAFPFAGFLAGLGASRRPSGLIVLRAADATADAAAFAAADIGEGRLLHFARSAAAPDGTDRTVSFSLAFATAPTMPDVGFFTCQQHRPENFWNPAYQRHPNGVTGVAAVTIVAGRPADHAGFLARFANQRAEPIASGIAVDCGNGRIEVIEPAAAAARFGGDLPADGAARLAAITFTGAALTAPERRVRLDERLVLVFG